MTILYVLAYYENYRHWHTWHPAPPNQTTPRCFISETSQCKFFIFCLLFTFLLNGTVMAKHTAGPKKEFFSPQNPANQVSGFGTAKRKKCIFPLSKIISLGKCIHQPRFKKKQQKKTSYMSFYHCSFSGRSNKIPAQPDLCVYIYIYIYK